MADDKVKLRVEADASQAKAELDSVNESIENIDETAADAASPGGGLGGLVGKLTDLAGKGIAVVSAFTLAYQQTRQVIEGLKDLGVDVDKSTRGWADWVAGVDAAEAALGSFATAADAANKSLESVRQVREKYNAALTEERELLESTSQAIRDQIVDEQARGEVQKKTLEWIKETLDRYEELGDQVPENLLNVADALGVVSTAQEKAAAAADKAAEAAEKAALKAEEQAAREVEAAEKRAAAAEDASRRKIAAAEAEIAVAEKSLKVAQDEYDLEVERNRAGGDSAAAKELQQLRAKGVLTTEELRRLQELEDATRSLASAERQRSDLRQAQLREDEAFAVVQEERGKLEQAEYNRRELALEQARAQTAATRQNTDAIEGNAVVWDEASRTLKTAADATATFGEELDVVADAAPKATEGVETLSESMGTTADAAERSAKALEQIRSILPEIITLAAQVRLGGAG